RRGGDADPKDSQLARAVDDGVSHPGGDDDAVAIAEPLVDGGVARERARAAEHEEKPELAAVSFRGQRADELAGDEAARRRRDRLDAAGEALAAEESLRA